jgi:hypothetical protein
MSLRRYFTGKPGNFEEVIETAQKDNSPVEVKLVSYDDMNGMGDETIEGCVFYSGEIRGERYRLKITPAIFGGGIFDAQWTGERMQKVLWKTQEGNLERLKRSGIECTLVNDNRCLS